MFLTPLIKHFIKGRESSLRRHYTEPLALQEKVFSQLIHYGASTQFGRQYGFRHIRSRDDFARKVPVQAYESLFPWFQKVLRGEPSVLWPGRVSWFAKTSGSTNDRSKYIPITREALYQCHYRAAKDALAIYFIHKPNSRLFDGKGFILGGSSAIHPEFKGIRTGDLSAVLMHNSSWLSRWLRVPSNKVALLGDWEKKMAVLVKLLPRFSVTSLSGVPSWMLVLLEKILESRRAFTLEAIWPQLELFIHGAVNFEPYRERFRAIFGNLPVHFLETYNASEGFFAIQDIPDSDQMLLLLDHGIFYEFVPLDKIHEPFPPAYHLGEVKTGITYAMVISTNGGLWRYLIGDTVRFTSLHPFRIRIAGRTKHFINVFGEELMVENAERAISECARKFGVTVLNFTAGPMYMKVGSPGAHEWLLEFAEEPPPLDAFGQALDQALRQLNSDYDAKRVGDYALGPPILHAVPKGTFDRWLKLKNRLGGQHKVPRLSNERTILEEIRQLL